MLYIAPQETEEPEKGNTETNKWIDPFTVDPFIAHKKRTYQNQRTEQYYMRMSV